jgi:hypothetical protein
MDAADGVEAACRFNIEAPAPASFDPGILVGVDADGADEDGMELTKCLFFPLVPVCSQTFNESKGWPRMTPQDPAAYPAMALFRIEFPLTLSAISLVDGLETDILRVSFLLLVETNIVLIFGKMC